MIIILGYPMIIIATARKCRRPGSGEFPADLMDPTQAQYPLKQGPKCRISSPERKVSQKEGKHPTDTYQTYQMSFEKRNCQVSIIMCAMVKYSLLYLFVRNGDQLSKGFIHTILSRFPWNEMHDHKLLVTGPLYFMIFP